MWIDDFSKENPHGIIKYITENYKGNLPFSKKHAIQISGYGNKELTDPNIKLQDMNDIIPNLHPESYIVIGFKVIFPQWWHLRLKSSRLIRMGGLPLGIL